MGEEDQLLPGLGPEEAAAPAGPRRYARVAVERGIDSHAGSLTYGIGDEDVHIGERVQVPLGRKDRRAAGVVVQVGGDELLEGLSPRRVKPIIRRAGSALPAPLVELARWMADYYVCPLGMVLATMMPAAVKKAIGRARRVEVEPVEPAEAERILAGARFKGATKAAWEGIAGLDRAVFPLPPRDVADRLGQRTVAAVNRLIDAGLLRTLEREVIKSRVSPWDGHAVHAPAITDLTPSPEQQRAADGISAALGGFGVHLLRGVTGSGKTEVYLRVIDRVLARGQTALVLVPEIALTPQTAGRFLERFEASGVAVLHSGLSEAERHRQWAMAAGGAAKVVVGARSAVFAPLKDLGLIVVDEEHDPSYKQDQLPRYHARDVATMRGKIEGCPVLLGSATPSLESWSKAKRADPHWHLWEMDERVGGAKLPVVEVIDLLQERKLRAASPEGTGGRFHLLGPRLEDALEETLEMGKQAILLLNRRGYAGYIACPDQRCGWVMGCEHCDARMVLHRHSELPKGGLMRCHHCLTEMKMPQHCPLCGLRPIALGMGTQQLEEEIVQKFGESRGLRSADTLLRVDSDTMRSGRDYFEALAGFASGRVRVLVGTQMIAKGLDFPNVRLVGVVNADTALSIPDFRATERTFQLVSQVAGRAGRSTDPGRVIVQTMGPETPAIWYAARHDYRTFAEQELALRAEAALPPAVRMARVIVRDKDFHEATAHAERLAARLRRTVAEQRSRVRIVGPMPCPISRIAGQFRVAIEMTAPKPSELHKPLDALRREGLLKSDAVTAVDVDPVALM